MLLLITVIYEDKCKFIIYSCLTIICKNILYILQIIIKNFQYKIEMIIRRLHNTFFHDTIWIGLLCFFVPKICHFTHLTMCPKNTVSYIFIYNFYFIFSFKHIIVYYLRYIFMYNLCTVICAVQYYILYCTDLYLIFLSFTIRLFTIRSHPRDGLLLYPGQGAKNCNFHPDEIFKWHH